MRADKDPGLSIDPRSSRLEKLGRGLSLLGALGLKNTTQLLRERLKDPTSRLIIQAEFATLVSPLFLTASQGDLAVATEVVARERYRLDPKHKTFVQDLPIVDLGANIGASSAYFASHYPETPVIAVEPNSRNIEILKFNAGMYGGQITVVEGAFAGGPGMIELSNPEVASAGRHEAYRYDSVTDDIEKEVAIAIPPGDIIRAVKKAGYDRIGLLKVNIKGAEKDIFESEVVDTMLGMANVAIIEASDVRNQGAVAAVVGAAERNGLWQFDQRGNFYFFAHSSLPLGAEQAA